MTEHSIWKSLQNVSFYNIASEESYVTKNPSNSLEFSWISE